MEEGKEARPQTAPVEDMAAAPEPGPPPVGREQLREWNETLRRYRAAKAELDRRVVAAEEWWRLRNANEEGRERGAKDAPGQFRSVSGWLHNVIVSKHADAMDNYPTANVLPRESGDRAEAAMLSSVIPAILEQNRFESTYSDAMWQKLKTGTGVYKVTWDARKLQGLGDIRIQRVNLLNLFWEPNITDIQESRMVFHLETADREELERQWPVLRGRLKSGGPERARFRDEDSAADADKVTVVEVYYKKHDGARQMLHYCKYAGTWCCTPRRTRAAPTQAFRRSCRPRSAAFTTTGAIPSSSTGCSRWREAPAATASWISAAIHRRRSTF